MTHVPQRPERYQQDFEYVQSARPPQPPAPQLTVTDRAPARVIFGPRGEVLKVIEDPRPRIGFR